MSKKANKRLLYVGGLADEVTADVLKGAFLPFGDLVDVQLPLDFHTRMSVRFLWFTV